MTEHQNIHLSLHDKGSLLLFVQSVGEMSPSSLATQACHHDYGLPMDIASQDVVIVIVVRDNDRVLFRAGSIFCETGDRPYSAREGQQANDMLTVSGSPGTVTLQDTLSFPDSLGIVPEQKALERMRIVLRV